MSERFVWNIGAIREELPDMPEQGTDTVLWDRQERRPVVTVHGVYRQAICLETTDSSPFTDLATWLNGAEPGVLESEGIPGTKKPGPKPAMTLWTTAAWEQFDPDAESRHGPPNNREHFYSPSGERLELTTDDREQFEEETGAPFMEDDTLTLEQWQQLTQWLKDNDLIQEGQP